MVKINEIDSHESKEHLEAKIKLFELMSNNRVTFKDQFGKEFNITPNITWTDLYMEAYVYDDENNDPCKGSQCKWCYFGTEEFINKVKNDKNITCDNITEDYLNDRFDKDEFNGVLHFKKDGINAFKQHPCSICKFKGIANCIAIFDIACSINDKYLIAIEIVKTSKCSENKIQYCKKNNIFLIEVYYEDILKLKDNETELLCASQWWIERYRDKGLKRSILDFKNN